MQYLFKLIKTNIKYSFSLKDIILIISFSIVYSVYGLNLFRNFDNNISVGDIFIRLYGGVDYKLYNILDYVRLIGFQIVLIYPILKWIYIEFEEKVSLTLFRIKNYSFWMYSIIISGILKCIFYMLIIYITTIIITTFKLGFSTELVAIDKQFITLINSNEKSIETLELLTGLG